MNINDVYRIIDDFIADIQKTTNKENVGVGDELKYTEEDDDDTALTYVVTRIYQGKYEAICPDGAVYRDLDISRMVKAGRVFTSEIDNLFLKMNEPL